MNILPSILLFLALFASIILAVRALDACFGKKERKDVTMNIVIICLFWTLFYHLK
jgi:hypothetical protein